MRIGGREIKPAWLIGGGVAIFFLVGLFYDVGQTYFRKKSLDRSVRNVVESTAKSYLPFRPQDAILYALAKLEEEGLPADPGSVVVAPDGSSIEITVRSKVTAYFAWIVGNPSLEFQARAIADVKMEGEKPVDELPFGEVAFALIDYPDFKFLENLVVAPSGDPSVPDFAVKGYAVTGPANLVVGQKAAVAPIADMEKFSSRNVWVVAILGPAEAGLAEVKGFAAMDAPGLDEKGWVVGQFIRKAASGESKRDLPEGHDFGLVRGGEPKVVIR